MQLSDLTAMLSNPPNEFNNWSGKGVAEIILPLVAAHPKVRLFKRKPTSILNLTYLQLSNMEARLEKLQRFAGNFHSNSYSFQFADKEARLDSFKDWPEALEIRPEELAEAGFYHFPTKSSALRVSAIGT